MEIILCINGQQLEARYPKLYSGSIGVLYAKFAEVDFDNTLIKAVRFKTAYSDWYTADITDGAVRVPHEVIVQGGFDIALAGYEENNGELTKFLPTNSVHIEVMENGYGAPDAPLESEGKPESYAAQVDRLVAEAAETAEAAKSAAENALTVLDKKANSADVYTKTESDDLYDNKVDKVSGKGLSTVSDIAVLAKEEAIVKNGTAATTNLPINEVVFSYENGSKSYYEFVSGEHRDSFDHPDKSVTTSKIADNAVTLDKLNDDVRNELDKKSDSETAEGTIVRTGTRLGPAGTIIEVMNLATAADELSLDNKSGIEELQAEKADKTDLAAKADEELLKKLIPKSTVSGNPIMLADHAEGVPVIDYKIYGNSVQDGTPSPENPIEIESVGELVTDEADEHYGRYKIPIDVHGKNLIPYPYYSKSGLFNELSVTVLDDGRLLIDGTPNTITAVFEVRYNAQMPVSDSYTLSLKIVSGSMSGTCYIQPWVDGVFKTRIDIGGSRTYQWNGVLNRIALFMQTDCVFDNCTVEFQLEKGETATDYEPYYTPQTYDVYADEPLRKVGDYADYVDFANQKIVRKIKVLNDTGTMTIGESLAVRETPGVEAIEAPPITVPEIAAVHINTNTEVIGNMDISYYQDINKKLIELREAIADI